MPEILGKSVGAIGYGLMGTVPIRKAAMYQKPYLLLTNFRPHLACQPMFPVPSFRCNEGGLGYGCQVSYCHLSNELCVRD